MNTELLKQKAEMVEEYFGIHIDEHGNVSRLPGDTNDKDRVLEFSLCLGNDVSYKSLCSFSLYLFAEMSVNFFPV